MSKKSIDEEVADQCRIVDMMLSMHTRLRQKLVQLSTTFDVVRLIGAAVLVSTSFSDPMVWSVLGLPGLDTIRIARVVSTILLIMGIVALRLNWATKAGAHEKASQTLAKLKSQLRLLRDQAAEKTDAVKKDELRAIQTILADLPPIPPRRFHRLKAHHLRKVAVSKLLDKHPGAPVWLLRIQLFLRDVVGSFRSSSQHGDKNAQRG